MDLLLLGTKIGLYIKLRVMKILIIYTFGMVRNGNLITNLRIMDHETLFRLVQGIY